jgi:hypothetical protein
VDATIAFTLAWAAPDGSDAKQANENDPNRAIPATWEITSNEFRPGSRHTFTVINPDVGEMMVTCSHGTFEEQGALLDGDLGYGSGTAGGCAGKRYNTRLKKPNTRLIWNAPDSLELEGSDVGRKAVVFKVTAASSETGAFRNNEVTFYSNARLPVPVAGTASATPAPGVQDAINAAHSPSASEGVSLVVKAHGWLLTSAWAVFVPFGVWSARHGKAPPGSDAPAAAAPSGFKRALLWFRTDGRWFRVHRALTGIGLVFAFLGFVIMYAEVDEYTDEHFESSHASFGVATLVLGLSQPLNAAVRPRGPTAAERIAGVGKSAKRNAWEMAHRVSGALAFILSVFAITSGMGRAEEWGEPSTDVKRAKRAYFGWVAFVIAATFVFEVARYREWRHAKPTHEEIKEMELGEVS